MTAPPPSTIDPRCETGTPPAEASRNGDRRRHRRLPVTLSARVHHAERSYRTQILDVSDGGVLLSPIAALAAGEQQLIHIESATIGRVEARIVAISPLGIHAHIEDAAGRYHEAIERLFGLTRAWTGTGLAERSATSEPT